MTAHASFIPPRPPPRPRPPPDWPEQHVLGAVEVGGDIACEMGPSGFWRSEVAADAGHSIGLGAVQGE